MITCLTDVLADRQNCYGFHPPIAYQRLGENECRLAALD